MEFLCSGRIVRLRGMMDVELEALPRAAFFVPPSLLPSLQHHQHVSDTAAKCGDKSLIAPLLTGQASRHVTKHNDAEANDI